MSRTIEAIMRHMAPPARSSDKSKQQSREAGKGNHGRKAAITIRAHQQLDTRFRSNQSCRGEFRLVAQVRERSREILTRAGGSANVFVPLRGGACLPGMLRQETWSFTKPLLGATLWT